MRIRGETNKGNIMEDTCSRSPDQEEGADKAFFRWMKEASLVLVNHPDIEAICNVESFQSALRTIFLAREIGVLTRGDTPLGVLFTKREEFMWGMKDGINFC